VLARAKPRAGATDARVPELNGDPTIVRTSAVKMSAAIQEVLTHYPAVIEAKFEIGDDGHLSLSIYPVSKALKIDAEHQDFFELAGNPTSHYAPSATRFDVPDVEHVTRSARDLTLVQTMRMSITNAIAKAESLINHGVVYWVIPTIRGPRAGFGVYVLDQANQTHYLFIS
jgi:hypothetical protein